MLIIYERTLLVHPEPRGFNTISRTSAPFDVTRWSPMSYGGPKRPWVRLDSISVVEPALTKLSELFLRTIGAGGRRILSLTVSRWCEADSWRGLAVAWLDCAMTTCGMSN